MKGITVFETLTDIREDYIRDAELDACFLTAPVRKRERGPSVFSRFMNSGWGVAIICALVAVSVMGGIIWAGFHAGDVPPGHNDAITGEVYLTAGGQTVIPEAFFGYSEVHKGNQTAMSCGAGFYGEFTVSPIPTLTTLDGIQLHMPDNYTLDAIYVYDTESPLEVLDTFEHIENLDLLKPNTYYIALRITHTEGKNKYGYDYAFCLTVMLPIMEKPYEWPTFNPSASVFLGDNTGTYPDGGSVANIPLTAAYTKVKTPEGTAWYVMTARYAKGAGDGGPIFLLYDSQKDPSTPYIAIDRQLQFIYPPVRTLLQLEDGRLITLHADDDLTTHRGYLEVTANQWMWSKVDPDTGEELEEIQLCPMGESWSYTFDLTNSLRASRDWQYAFATYIYGLTNGETPTLRVLLDNLFCETDEIKYDLAQYEHFSEEENLTTGWARLQRIMNGELRPDLWVQPESLDLSFCEFALGHRLHVKFHPDGHIWILIGQLDAIREIYKGTYVLREGQITIDCPVDANYFGFSLHGAHTFETSEESVKIGDLTVQTKSNDGTCPAVFVPLIMAYFDEYNASVPEYRQDQPEGYAVMDMDGDGTREVVVKLAWDQKTSYDRSVVFFIDYDAEKILDHAEISYNHLYVDGSFSYTVDRTGPSYGVDKLVATEMGYEARTLWRICNDGTENAEYFIGDRKVTKEELEAYTAEIKCEKVTWSACCWEVTELETDFREETEDGKG